MNGNNFRVWCSVTKSFGGGNLWHLASDGTLFYGNAEWPEGIVMWFIGLHDKNGKKVFEGDILRRDAYCDMFVEFHDGAFCLVSCDRIQRINWTPIPIGKADIAYREIVGNIYENPDMLTT